MTFKRSTRACAQGVVANARVLAFNIRAEYLLSSCFSAAALGMIVGKLY
jgi:hypothetical protein